MSAAFQTEAITDAVNDALKSYLKTIHSLRDVCSPQERAGLHAGVIQADGSTRLRSNLSAGSGSTQERAGLHAGVIQAAAMIHTAAIQALATVEAAEIQAAALDRLAIAIRSKRGD